MLSHALLILLLSAASLSAAGDELASCCGLCGEAIPARFFDTVEDMSSMADAVPLLFVGKVIKAETLDCGDCYAYITFRVGKTWKGDAQPTLTLLTGGGCARPFPFAIGQEYLVAGGETHNSAVPFKVHIAFTPIEAAAAQPYIQALDDWHQAKPGPKPTK